MKRADIIRWALDWLIANDQAFTEELQVRFEVEARREWGGVPNRPWVKPSGTPGRPPKKSPDEVLRAYTDALSAAPTEKVLHQHGISRATLYRLVKRGPRRP